MEDVRRHAIWEVIWTAMEIATPAQIIALNALLRALANCARTPIHSLLLDLAI